MKDNTQAFIVRIWYEPRDIQGADPIWRGMIEHISTGTRRYFKNLDEIPVFIVPYLKEEGVKLPLYWRLRDWLNRRKRREDQPN